MGADRVAAEPPLGFPGQLGLGEKMADGRIRSGEANARSLADKAAAAVAADEILRLQRPAVAERDVDAGRVLCEARDLDAAQDRHTELLGPVEHDALAVLLDEREAVRVAARECADVEAHAGEAEHLHRLSFGEEPVGDAALVEHLDRTRMETERTGLDALLVSRFSTMTTSTPASVNSAPSISPVGPPPAMITACLVMSTSPRFRNWSARFTRWPGT